MGSTSEAGLVATLLVGIVDGEDSFGTSLDEAVDEEGEEDAKEGEEENEAEEVGAGALGDDFSFVAVDELDLEFVGHFVPLAEFEHGSGWR